MKAGIIILLILYLPAYLIAQNTNQAWTGLSLDLGINNKWKAGYRQEFRFYTEDQDFNNIFGDICLGRSVNKNITASAGMRLSQRHYPDFDLSFLRYYGYVLWNNKTGPFHLTARSGIQNDNPRNAVYEYNLGPSTLWRNLAELGYSFPGKRISALVFCEFFKKINHTDYINFEELRVKPYIKFDISKNHELSSGYIYRYNYLLNSQEGHILTINYKARININ